MSARHQNSSIDERIQLQRRLIRLRTNSRANTSKLSGTARSSERLNGEVMSIAILATLVTLTIAQLVFWETLGETLCFAASVSVLGLSASLSLILAAYVAAIHAFRPEQHR
jgi:hypothetical protein